MLFQNYFKNNVYRYGGDEFVILTKLSIKEIEVHLNQISTSFISSFKTIKPTFSTGIYFVNETCSMNELLQKVDKALYIAKQNKTKSSYYYINLDS